MERKKKLRKKERKKERKKLMTEKESEITKVEIEIKKN